jgi:hypothetical protein
MNLTGSLRPASTQSHTKPLQAMLPQQLPLMLVPYITYMKHMKPPTPGQTKVLDESSYPAASFSYIYQHDIP